MKLFRSKYSWVIMTLVLAIGYVASCTKENQVLDVPGTQVDETTDLVSMKTTTAPTMDGVIDDSWKNALKLNFSAAVPDPGNNLFTGYISESYEGTIRSMYDDNYIYFLAEIKDNEKSVKSAPWYFNPATKRWAQEPTSRSFDVNGSMTREGFGEDKLAMLWNINNSTPKFISQTCYASCHVFTPYMDYSVTPPVYRSNASSGNHYTNGVNEKIDMWWAHPNRGLAFGKMDDNYQDWAGGPAVTNLTGGNANGRHFDDLVVSGTSSTWPNRPNYTADATQGSINNRQTVQLNGTTINATIPLWFIPNTNNYDFIKAEDTLGGRAVKITSADTTGVLYYNGGSIDPTVGTDYQRVGDPVTGGLGQKSIPGVVIAPVLRGRADIDMVAQFVSTADFTGWIYEFKRLLKTADPINLKQDVDFTYEKDAVTNQMKDHPFGIAIWNKSNYQHGIKPNLMLKFQKP